MSEITVAFIGLGNMGGGMAANLVKAGYRVIGFDVAEAMVETACANGIEAGDTLLDCVKSADFIFTMLPTGKHVLDVWSEILPVARPGSLISDCSTVDVATTRKLHELAAKHNLESVDAPVSGGVGGARAGTLTFMVGGSQEAFARVEPLLRRMGQKAVRCGDGGAGQAAKICNNMILGITIVGVSEAFVLGEKLGLSHEALFDVASTSSGQCWALTTYCPVPGPVPTSPANGDYRPGAPATMLLKDLRLSQDAASDAHAHTPLGKHATEIYDAFVADGHGGEDFSAIVRYLREKSV